MNKEPVTEKGQETEKSTEQKESKTKKPMSKSTLMLVRGAIIAALYASLTIALQPFSYGPVQFRVSEALTILPLYFVEAIPGLAIGCLLANIFGGFGIYDIVFGTLATLAAAILTRKLKKIYLGIIPPIVINAFVVPIIFLISGDTAYWLNVATVGAGQAGAIAIIGIPLYYALRPLVKRGVLQQS